MSNGVEAIAAERKRQIEIEGWMAAHDDAHTDQSLALVAALYAAPFPLYGLETEPGFFAFEDPWPASWDRGWDKRNRHDRRRRLEIAGALIAAEIDRIDRNTSETGGTA